MFSIQRHPPPLTVSAILGPLLLPLALKVDDAQKKPAPEPTPAPAPEPEPEPAPKAAKAAIVPQPAAAVPTAVQQIDTLKKPEEMNVATWISDTLVAKRGVLASIPGAGAVSLDVGLASGRAWWWMWKISKTKMRQVESYRTDKNTAVYRSVDYEAVKWLPDSNVYKIDDVEFEKLTILGVSVTVMDTPTILSIHDTMAGVSTRIAMEMDIAQQSLAPAVLGIVLVFNNDKYENFERDGRKKADDDATDIDDVKSDDSTKIVSVVTVAQNHTYCLNEMLESYSKLDMAHPNLRYEESQLSKMAVLLLKSVWKLSRSGYVKLNMVPQTIVAVPAMHLTEGQDQWTAEGVSYTSDCVEYDPIEGNPMFSNFDLRFTKTNADPDCAHLAMSLILLAAIRAEFGEAYLPFYTAFMKDDGSSMSSIPATVSRIKQDKSPNKVKNFCNFLLRCDAEVNPTIDEICKDFEDVVNYLGSAPNSPIAFDVNRILFNRLLLKTTQSTSISIGLFGPNTPSDLVADRQQAINDEKKLEQVVKNGRQNWLNVEANRSQKEQDAQEVEAAEAAEAAEASK